MMQSDDLYKEWLELKAAEAEAVDKRREIEDRLCKIHGILTTDKGTKSYDMEQGKTLYEVKITCRQDSKVDSDAVQEIAQEEGIPNKVLQDLFRWKPEVNATKWKAASKEITGKLAKAITVKPGRPSFKISIIEEK